MAVARNKIKSIGAAQSPLLGAAMFSPAVLYILLLVAGPFCLAIFYAFSDARIGNSEMHFVGLENFRSILQSPSFRIAIRNSLIFTICSQIVVIVGANILAISLENTFRGRGLIRFLILLPWVAPIALGAIGWKWILDSIYSVITWILVAVHIYKPFSAPMWLGEPSLAITSVLLVHSWRLMPFSTVILLAGRTAIPKDIPEAAAVDGAGFWRTQLQIVIPMMRPIISVAVLFGLIFTFTDMTVVYILTAGGPFDPAFAGLCDGHSGQRSCGGRCDLALPCACAGDHCLFHAARGPSRGGELMARGMSRSIWGKLVHVLVLATFTILLAFPFYWMLITSFKQNVDLYTMENNPFIFNAKPTLDHLKFLFTETRFVRWLGNTAFVGVVVVAITLLLAVPAAYSLARLSGRWGERLGIGIFLTYLIPPTLLFIPLSRVVAYLGLQDSLWALILVYPTFTVPFSIWLLMGFFKSIPKELEDAAMVDGLTRFGAFVKLVIPISVSGILTVVIFTFTLVTQEFVYALTFISSESNQMIGTGIPIFLVRGDVYYWGALMAACLIASLPIAFMYNLFLDRFIAGFTVGAIK